MDTYLSSENSRIGERFTATVFRNVVTDGRVVIPSGAKVEGHVTSVEKAESRSRAGTIGIGFDRLVFSNGHSIPVDGTLTTLDEEARARLEEDSIDAEDQVEGGSRTRRAVVFIGGGAGVGAVIGAVAGGGKGAAVGAGIGAVLGTIGVLLSKGDDAEVEPGTEFGMRLERSMSFAARRAGIDSFQYPYQGDDIYPPVRFSPVGAQTVFTSPEDIRDAQLALRDRGFYNGEINGVLNNITRDAIRQFQRQRNLRVTGDLDLNTARALGIAGSGGERAILVEVINPRAERIGRNSIRITADARVRTGGWQVYADHVVVGNTLHVYVRGIPPRTPSTQALDTRRVTTTINNTSGVTRVVFHGAQRDITIDLNGAGGGSVNVTNSREILRHTNQLLNSYMRVLNLRGNRNNIIFTNRQNLGGAEAELLFHLNSLQAAAELFNQLVLRVNDPEAVTGAAEALVRQARLVNRVMRQNEARLNLPSSIRSDWEQLRIELSRINPSYGNLDAGIND
jgi:peptidoglycan hydrolase-like protein with peptidoglycan-binding domain